MAVLLTEMTATGAGGGYAPVVDATHIVGQQIIAVDGAASDAFSVKTTLVEIDADGDCRVEFGPDPDGNGYSLFVPVGIPRQFGVQPGWKAIAVSA